MISRKNQTVVIQVDSIVGELKRFITPNLNFPDVIIYYGNYFFSFCWIHGEPLLFFSHAKNRGTNKNEGNRRKEDLMSKTSLYFLSINFKLFPTNILSDNSSLESALNVCCLHEEGLYVFLPA